jgi:cell division protein FtsX
MRRCLLLALPLALVLSACGSGHRSTASVPRTELGLQACYLRVFFGVRATHAQEQAVGEKLRQDPDVKQVEFTSKAQALALMKKRNPVLVKTLKLGRNPLPDSFTVVPVKRSDLKKIQASVAGARPGVATLKLDPCRRRN